MTKCPKCGGRKIIGPKWHQANWPVKECLGYTCYQCGYSETRPTKDAEHSEGRFPIMSAPTEDQ